MKIRFYSGFDYRGFDPKLKQLLMEVVKERGHTIGHPLPHRKDPVLITFIPGYESTIDHVPPACVGSGFLIVVNPGSLGYYFTRAGAYENLDLESQDEEGQRVEIAQYMEKLEKVVAEIT